MYAKVDDGGTIIEYYSFDDESLVPDNHFKLWVDRIFYQPKWDFSRNDWVETLSQEEIEKYKAEVEKQKAQPSTEEMNSMAIMELAEMILGG